MGEPPESGRTYPYKTLIVVSSVTVASFDGELGFYGTLASVNELTPDVTLPPAVIALTLS